MASRLASNWVLEDGIAFVRDLQQSIEIAGFHAGLLGSVLHRGSSRKDLDVAVFPYNTETCDRDWLLIRLKRFGMKQVLTREEVTAIWRSTGSQDTKNVEVWTWKNKRVDLFFLT